MKKLLLIMLSNFAFAQQIIDIRIVDPNVGTPILNSANPWAPTESNDAGLNAILSTYGVTNYNTYFGHPFPDYQSKTMAIVGSYALGLITDLNNYSAVIASAKVSSDGSYTDAVRSQLLIATVGAPTGVNGGIIVTNDPGLNTIFQTHNVFYYSQSFPSASAGNALLRYYDVVCNCNKNLLKAALDGYTTIIQNTENIHGGYILSNNQFEKPKPIISPNPFSNNFTIETDEVISNYSLFDISGKQLINTNSKTALDNLSSQLNSGVYFLNLELENGLKSNYKIVKK